MTSQLNVDTIVDKAGSGGTNVKIGNTSTYVSDGGAVTQNTVQGLAKAWLNLKGTDTFGINDSFNVSSCDDDGAGDYAVNINSAFSNDDFSSTSSCQGDSNNKNRAACTNNNSSSEIYLNTYIPSSANLGDLDEIHFAGHGDLA